MRISSNFDDFKKLRAALARIDKNKIHSALHSALNSTALHLIPIIKSFTPVKTGLLKSSWNFEILHGLSGATLIWALFTLRYLGLWILYVDKRCAKCRGDIKKRIKKRDRKNN